MHNYEAVRLARAVRKLRKLESLRVEVGNGDLKGPDSPYEEGEDLPLMRFMIALCCQEDEHAGGDPGCSSSLKLLALTQVPSR